MKRSQFLATLLSPLMIPVFGKVTEKKTEVSGQYLFYDGEGYVYWGDSPKPKLLRSVVTGELIHFESI